MTVSNYIKEHYSERRPIPVDKIKLTDRVHRYGKINRNIPYHEGRTLIVQDRGDYYVLVTGWNAYKQCLEAGINTVNCIVIKENRKEFTEKCGEGNKKVKNIKLPYTLKNSHPSAQKLSTAEENIKNGKFKPVVLSADDYIVDGYTRYLAAKKLGITSIPVNHVGWKVSKNGGKLPPKKGEQHINTCPHCGYKFEFGTRVGHFITINEETGESYFDYRKVCPKCKNEYPNDGVNFDYKET